MIDHLSHSQVQSFATCPRRWRYEKVDQAPRERISASLVFGIAIHDAVASIHESSLTGARPDARAVFVRRWRSAVDEAAAPVVFGADDGEDLIAKAIALLDQYRAPPGVIGIEQPFTVDLADDLPPIVGRIDLIRHNQDRELVLADIKSSSTRSLSETDAIEAQMALYQVAYPAAHHEAIVLAKLKRPVVSVQPVTPWPHRQLVAHYRDVYSAMKAGVRFAVRGWHCESCPFHDRCRRDS